MKKTLSKKFLYKARNVLGNYFGTAPIDKLELILEQPRRLFKNKIGVFFGSLVPKKYRTKYRISDWKIKERSEDLENESSIY